MPPPDLSPVRRALISVSDKHGLLPRARALAARGIEILSTGGTLAALAAESVPARDIAEVTGFPEMMDGRVKTLHPAIHGGILARRDAPSHLKALSDHAIPAIDLVIVNLYPFEQTAGGGASLEACVESIDVGGPALLRAAAKNHASVAACADWESVDAVLAALIAHDGATPLALRRRLARTAFARLAAYDATIAAWLGEAVDAALDRFAALGGPRLAELRYGENPHQAAAFYALAPARSGAAGARLLQGKPLSYNNIADADAAFEAVAEIAAKDAAAVVIVKHANPCGAALGASLTEAFEAARACDPVSAFGGVIALSRPLDAAAAEAIAALFTEVVIAPGVEEDAAQILAAKPNLRLLIADALPDPGAPGLQARTVAGGLLVQERDAGRVQREDLTVVTQRAPTPGEIEDLLFAWRVAKHVKSNAIVFAKDRVTAGIGAGQMSRLDAARIAARKAEDAARQAGWSAPRTVGSAAASDAFFPFADGLEELVKAGARAVIQPGGSVRDAEVVKAADAAGLAMVFTGMRHFRH